MRRKVSKVLREIHRARVAKNPKKHLKTLEELKKRAKKSDVMADGTLDKLIRQQLITSEMATSLANDSDNVAGICENLIDVAELLYIESDTLLSSLQAMDKKAKVA